MEYYWALEGVFRKKNEENVLSNTYLFYKQVSGTGVVFLRYYSISESLALFKNKLINKTPLVMSITSNDKKT